MNLVSLERVWKRYAEKLPLDGISFGIDEGDRVGVIGRNGSGKSTLLRIVAGVEEPDGGRVVHASALRVAYLAQDPAQDPALPADLTVGEAVGASRQAEAMLDRLGLRDASVRVAQLSGGQRKRVALARCLAEDTSLDTVGGEIGLLVLDEPTNHLDVSAVGWLESLLRARRGALLLVTHDRYLLDRLATRIVEVYRGALHAHQGSYESYLEARVVRADQAEAAERRRQNRLRTELEWLRRAPKARTSKSRLRMEQARALADRGPEVPEPEIVLDLPSRRLGTRVCDLSGVGKRFGDRWVLRGVDHRLAPGARVGLVGPNGAGKTTLLRLIAARLEPDEGEVRLGDTVVTGWYGQDAEPLPARQRVFEAIDEQVRNARVGDRTVGAGLLLERFGFEPEAQRAWVGELSGGERRRLELLRVLAGAPNLLLLDEPTNDLDLDTLGQLEAYLDSWPGAFVVATHDRYLLDRVCRDVYSIEPDGSLRHHPGGWAAYAGMAERRAPAVRRATPVRAAPSKPQPTRLSYRQRREFGQLDARLPTLHARRTELEAELERAAGDYEAARRIGEALTLAFEEIDRAETRWLELSELEDG
ncbi:MAG: ABC-F family ATP-binding cassette domain-containing protein [Egibacteraceae bacterium]